MTKQELFEYFNTTNSIENLANIVQTYFIDNNLDYSIITPEYIKTIIDKVTTSNIKYQNNISTKSIFAYIEKNIDLTDPIMTNSESISLIDEIIKSDKNYWKSSLNSLIRIWNERVSNQDQHSLNNLTNKKPEEITEASALLSFSSSDWVQPETKNSLNFQTQVGAQTDNSNARLGLKNSYHYQETNQSYLNLIMPKNSRRVEAADLNRNFWVIDSNISYLLKYLFDDTSPIIAMNTGIVKEISELWENMLYLWAAIYIIYGIKYHSLHFEVMYMPNDNYYPDRKFDNFTYSGMSLTEVVKNTVKERFSFMKQRYPYANLCIMPVIRDDNYESNYYSIERYPGLLLKSYNEKDFNFIEFNNGSSRSIMGVKVDERSDSSGLVFLNSVGYTDDDNPNYNCIYIYPFSQIDNFKELIPKTYTSAFRMVPTFKIDYSNEILTISNIRLSYYDVISANINEIYNVNQNVEYGYFKNQNSFSYNFSSNSNPTAIPFKFYLTNVGQQYSASNSSEALLEKTTLKRRGNIIDKFYLGECISNKQTTDYASFSFDKKVINLRPAIPVLNDVIIDSDSDKNAYSSGNLEYLKTKHQNEWNRLVINDGSILQVFSEEENSSSNMASADYSMVLYVGDHPMNTWGNSQTYTYYDYNANTGRNKKVNVTAKQNFAYHLFHGAAIYNPVQEKTIQYDDYCFYTYFPPDCNWSSLNKDSVLDGNTTTSPSWTGGHDDYVYYYTKENNSDVGNNWAIRYVQTAYCLSYPNSELSLIKDTTNTYTLPTEFQNNKWESSTWDFSNPKTLNLNWDVYAIPDTVRTTFKFSNNDGDTAMTYNERTWTHVLRITQYKQTYINWLANAYNSIARWGAEERKWITTIPDSDFDGAHYITYSQYYYDQVAEHFNNPLFVKADMPDVVTLFMEGKRYIWVSGYDPITGTETGTVQSAGSGIGYIQNQATHRNYALQNIANETSKYNSWVSNYEKELAKEWERHWQGSKTVTAYPVYSIITSHLFFADGKYASRSFIRKNNTDFDTESSHAIWYYEIVDRNKSGCDYDALRSLLPGYDSSLPGYDSSIGSDSICYILKDKDCTRQRYEKSSWINKDLDYEKYLIRGYTKDNVTAKKLS